MSQTDPNSNNATCESSPQSYNHCKTKKDKLEIASIKQKLDASSINIFISEILQDIMEENTYRRNKVIKNCFYIKNPPNMNFLDFSKRIIKYVKPECSTLVISLIYIDILLNLDRENLFLTENNIFKIFLTSLVLATKYNEDLYDDNGYFSKVGGVSLPEINSLEREFLILLDYKMYVGDDLFKIYEENLESANN